MKDDPRKTRELQRRMNPETLDTLIARGTDLRKPHKIINVFHIFKDEDVAPFLSKLKENGFVTLEKPQKLDYEGEEYWLVEAMKESLLSQEKLNEITDLSVGITSGFDADYDGWYAKVIHIFQ